MYSFLKKDQIKAFVLFVSLVFSATIGSAATEQVAQIPVPGMVTMVDLGAKKCIPCKMMAPILEELEKEYQESGSDRLHRCLGYPQCWQEVWYKSHTHPNILRC